MSTGYHVYANNGSGGPVDYSTIIATVSGLSYIGSALALSSDTTFAVRAFDTVSGLEESNIDARVRIIVSASGADVSAIPATPTLLGLTPTSGGTCRVDWLYIAAGNAPATSFAVYLTAGSTTTYGTPAATVSVVAGQSRYSTTISGLADDVAYVVSVRALNAAGNDGGTGLLPVIGLNSAPTAVDGLAGFAVITP